MKQATGRIAIVGFSCLLLFELLSQASVHWRESSEELGSLALYVFLAAGLVWACLPAFPERRLRILFRSVLVIALFIGTHTIIYFYSWHVRPNIGLYEESDWVAQHSGFQKYLRARIERNKW
jgi:predicted ferric reductase